MGLKGAAIGGVAGWFFGGPLGALFGAMFGDSVEKRVSNDRKPGSRQVNNGCGGKGAPRYCGTGDPNRDLAFCASAAAMLAKIAKTDGTVSEAEIHAVERAFTRLGFAKLTRDYAVSVFRKAKYDGHTVYEYAYNFQHAVRSVEVRELLYELLWDVACADGRIGADELEILRQIPLSLGVRPSWFEFYARERIAGYEGRYGRRGAATPRDSLSDAYELLGATPADDASELKRKYRELAKKFHPDSLRAQGLPEEMIGKANDRMAKINEAWALIKSKRGLL